MIFPPALWLIGDSFGLATRRTKQPAAAKRRDTCREERRAKNKRQRAARRTSQVVMKQPLIRYGRRKRRYRVPGLCVIGLNSGKGWQRRERSR